MGQDVIVRGEDCEVVECKKEGQKIEVPFIVPTPKPYIVDLGKYAEEQREEIKGKLLNRTQFLRELIRELGISEYEAYKRGMALNIATRDLLWSMAGHNFKVHNALKKSWKQW